MACMLILSELLSLSSYAVFFVSCVSFNQCFIMSSLNFLEAKLIMTSVFNDICGFIRIQHLSDSSVGLAMLIAKRLNMITVLAASSGNVFLLNAQPFSRSESES